MIEIDIRPSTARWRCTACGRKGRYVGSVRDAEELGANHRCGQRGRRAQPRIDIGDARVCRDCGEQKGADEFRLRTSGQHRQTLCRACENEYQKKHQRQADREAQIIY